MIALVDNGLDFGNHNNVWVDIGSNSPEDFMDTIKGNGRNGNSHVIGFFVHEEYVTGDLPAVKEGDCMSMSDFIEVFIDRYKED